MWGDFIQVDEPSTQHKTLCRSSFEAVAFQDVIATVFLAHQTKLRGTIIHVEILVLGEPTHQFESLDQTAHMCQLLQALLHKTTCISEPQQACLGDEVC